VEGDKGRVGEGVGGRRVGGGSPLVTLSAVAVRVNPRVQKVENVLNMRRECMSGSCDRTSSTIPKYMMNSCSVRPLLPFEYVCEIACIAGYGFQFSRH
jgi:hypothetical protein